MARRPVKRARVGISGWRYAPWRGKFYPSDLPQRTELEFAARCFDAIEINGTFYSLQRPESFGHWHDQTPADFQFAVKGPRFITHMLKLREVRTPLANFLASGVLRLGAKLGPVLWQFPESQRFVPERFAAFLELLPRDTDEALRLARRHDSRMKGRRWLECDVTMALRHAFEIRHESFASPEFLRLLKRHGAALVCADTVDWPLLMDLTADFVYCRLHGSRQLYVSGYGPKALDRWATRIRAWQRGAEPRDATRVLPPTRRRASGRDVYVFFDNDAKVRAPVDARNLQRRLLSAASRTRPRRP